ncbi:12300_t:CDS:2 [Entrophospora sp. SA101]|nr:8139_t:CDS:2 [Entrophospora sp. SA101]CAJ0628298.1 12300_t:CDS:2 [Entrophospora sp. SA101]CAJ0905447.1 4530_t:CDS:2 [Entrophospora sp. SA101]CAJ0918844.1 20751_t:CDS:2 [Entrophospora sp. SA101]
MGNASSSNSRSERSVRSEYDCSSRQQLVELYRTNVKSADIVKRKIRNGGGSTSILHIGLRVTIDDGRKFLIHSTNASSAQVITDARHMNDNNWKTVEEGLTPKNDTTVGSFMKTARKDGGYNLIKNNCHHTVKKIKKNHF